MGIEYELKFLATPQQQDLVRQLLEGPEQTISMETTYYDTPSGALAKRHYTLRRRLENGRSVCTLKTPDPQGRREWELACGDIEDAVSGLLAMGCPGCLEELAQEGLLPVCGARFTRIAKTVTLPECTVEVALDAGWLSGGGRELPLREIEVELKAGNAQAAGAFAQGLASGIGLTPETQSKFARALALYREETHG